MTSCIGKFGQNVLGFGFSVLMGEIEQSLPGQRGSDNILTRTTAVFTDVEGTFFAVRERREYVQ